MTFQSSAIKTLDVLFRRFGQTARLVFADGTGAEALVIHRLPDTLTDVFEAQIHSGSDLFELRISDIPDEKKLEAIVLREKRYAAQGEPVKDQHNLVLKVEAHGVKSSP